MQHCHTTGDSKAPACITIANGLLSIKAEGGQRLFKLDMGAGNVLESTSDEPVKTEPRAQDETLHHEGEMQENKSQETWPFTEPVGKHSHLLLKTRRMDNREGHHKKE